MKLTPEHTQIADTVRKFVAKEINPHIAQWEAAGQFPAHELFKKMGDAGLLGVDKPVEFGGSGLDFSYAMVCAESLGWVNGDSIPMATGVIDTGAFLNALAGIGCDAPIRCEPFNAALRAKPKEEILATVAESMKKALALLKS